MYLSALDTTQDKRIKRGPTFARGNRIRLHLGLMFLVLMCVSSLVVPVQAASFIRLQGGAATASARGLPTSVSVSTTRQNDNATSEQYALGALPEKIPENSRVTPVWAAALPTHFDWRDNGGYNYMTSVKNQGGCGSCVGFAAVGTVEAQYKITYRNPSWNLDLSEQHLFTWRRTVRIRLVHQRRIESLAGLRNA